MKINLRKKILIAPAVLLSVLFFNLSVGIGNDSFVKLFPVASACHKTYSLSGYEWTDIRASEEACNTYCENKGYNKGTVTASGDKICSGAECSYISNFTTGEQDKVGNDGHCGCDSQFVCACGNEEVKKPDLIVKDMYIEPENPTTDDTVCLYATIKNIGTEDVEFHGLTSWTYVNGFHAANTSYGKNISVGEKITKEVFCSKYGDNVWFEEGTNSVKVNIDPSAVNVVDESNENNNEKTISFTIIESVPETVCGNGICETGETLENCAKDCNEIYPSESDVDYCVNNTGIKRSTIGEGSATWFLWNGCSKYKVYNVESNKQIEMKITGDSCSCCVCYSPSFIIYEYNSQTGNWVETKEYTKPGYRGYSDSLLYTPKYSKIKVVASRCFYLKIYGETVEDENDNDDEDNDGNDEDSDNNNSDNCLPDGTLIKLPNDPRIFVIKNCKKQWIKTAEEFKSNGYKWSDVNNASKKEVDAYADYLEETAKLLRSRGHNKVYRIFNGKVLWVPTVSAFNAQGLKWEDIQDDDEMDINKYPKVKLIRGENDNRIFYITNSGMKKHLVNTETFNSYNNKYSDVVEVDSEVVDSFDTVNLFKNNEEDKVYKIEGNKKRWIKSAEAFNKHNFDWNKIALVNNVELNAYEDDKVIE